MLASNYCIESYSVAIQYDQEYWSLSERERLDRARDNYLAWKRIVARSRARLSGPTVAKVVIDSGSRFIDVWGRVTESKPVTATIRFTNEPYRRQYLADFERYMAAMLEYERLKSDFEKHDSHRRPSSAHRQAPMDKPPGTTGVDVPNESPDSDSHCNEEIRNKILEQLRQSIARARELKTDEAIADVLDDVVEAQRSGMDEESDDALLAMSEVARENMEESMREARRKRSRKSVENLVRDMEKVQLLPGDDETEAAYELAGDILDELDDKAEEWFRKKPTKQRFFFRLRRMAEAQFFGRKDEHDWLAGTVRRKPGDTYVTQPGDTLSKIAIEFYGDASRWDVLYVTNYGAVGNDPNHILPNVTLRIP